MRLAIVNDQKIEVEIVRRILNNNPDYEIIWTAENGAEAVEMCVKELPDILLMNLYMPVMDGVESTRIIMKNTPCHILIITKTVEKNKAKVFEAMGYGALDAVSTPSFAPDGKILGGATLLNKIAVIKKLIGNKPVTKDVYNPHKGKVPIIILIGASTGGPKALAAILSALPEDMNAAFVIVQHVDVEFSSGLVEWLNAQTRSKVKLIKNGDRIESGIIYVAGTNDHLILKKNLTFSYTSEPADNPYRPSVDILFKSFAENWPEKSAAVLLTGMGSDGAEGLKILRDKDWHTIAQDKSTSVVFGMPKAAVELGAAREVLTLKDIAGSIIKYIDKRKN